MKQTNEELISIKKNCLKYIELGNRKVFVVIKGVSRSGMMRNMNFYTFYKDDKGQIQKIYLNYFISKLCNYSQDKNTSCLKVRGCGMDMAFSVVYNLGRVLYPKGDGLTITGRNGNKEPEKDGGYLLDYETL